MSVLRFLGIVEQHGQSSPARLQPPARQRKLALEPLDDRALLTLLTPIVVDTVDGLIESPPPLLEESVDASSGDSGSGSWNEEPTTDSTTGSSGGEPGEAPVGSGDGSGSTSAGGSGAESPTNPTSDTGSGDGGGESLPEATGGSAGGSAGGESGDPTSGPESGTGSGGGEGSSLPTGSGDGSGSTSGGGEGGEPPSNPGSGSGTGSGGGEGSIPGGSSQGGSGSADPEISELTFERMGTFVTFAGIVADDESLVGCFVYFSTDMGTQFSIAIAADGTFNTYTMYLSVGTIVTAYAVDADGNHSATVTRIV
jgi:hypothetical protein